MSLVQRLEQEIATLDKIESQAGKILRMIKGPTNDLRAILHKLKIVTLLGSLKNSDSRLLPYIEVGPEYRGILNQVTGNFGQFMVSYKRKLTRYWGIETQYDSLFDSPAIKNWEKFDDFYSRFQSEISKDEKQLRQEDRLEINNASEDWIRDVLENAMVEKDSQLDYFKAQKILRWNEIRLQEPWANYKLFPSGTNWEEKALWANRIVQESDLSDKTKRELNMAAKEWRYYHKHNAEAQSDPEDPSAKDKYFLGEKHLAWVTYYTDNQSERAKLIGYARLKTQIQEVIGAFKSARSVMKRGEYLIYQSKGKISEDTRRKLIQLAHAWAEYYFKLATSISMSYYEKQKGET